MDELNKKKFELVKPSCNLDTVFDGRGGIFTWIPEENIKEFNMLYFKPGASRGNHFHPEFVEYFLVVEGSGAMVFKDPETGEERILHMSKGECSRAEPGVAHAFHAVTPVTAVAMLSKPWDECSPPIIHENVSGTDVTKMAREEGHLTPEKRGFAEEKKGLRIGLFGAKGFVGSGISKALKRYGYEVTEITRENFEENLEKEFDYVINAACPGARYKANTNPGWDFKETIEKTYRIFYEAKFKKFIQISSVSARCESDNVYGKNRLAAESIVNNEKSLIVRLGPMYDKSLTKGVLTDMTKGLDIFFSGNSKYAFAPLEFVGEWITKNLDRRGLFEVGAKNSISLQEIANKCNLNLKFGNKENHQEIKNVEKNYPDANLVIDFVKEKLSENKLQKDVPKRIRHCRVCGNPKLVSCIDVGEQYLSSIFPENLDYKDKLQKYPLEIVQCLKTDDSQCGSLQLAFDYDLSEMYQNYPYTSSSNSSMKKILEDVANSGKKLNNLKEGDTILDIGGNDGTLLSFFERYDLNLVNIDPAQNIESNVNSEKFVRVKDFFTAENFKKVSKDKAKLVFGIAMFYHLKNPIQFCKEIEEILDEEGVVIIQMAYLPSMIDTNMYDNIVHEHVGYYGVQQMKWILEKAGLEVFDVELNDIYGGSFKIFAKKKNNFRFQLTQRLRETLNDEINWGIFNKSTYSNFMERINQTRYELKALLGKVKQEGKKVWIYGASTKGNTIMQFCGIGPDLVEAAADSNSFKFGKYMVGSDIPIFNETKLRQEKPDYLLALPYSFVEGFRQREKELVEKETKFIVPLPEVKIL